MSRSRFRVSTVFDGHDNMSDVLARMSRNVNQFARNTERSVARTNNRLARTSRALQHGMTRTTIVAGVATAAIAKTVDVGASYDQRIVNAASRFPGIVRKGTDSFKELDAAARHVGETTEFTATQAAGALDYLARSGYSVKGAILALPDIVNLATVAEIDLARAADIATDALGQFGLKNSDPEIQAENLRRIIDVLAHSSNSANMNIEQMFESLKKGAPMMKAAGTEIETAAAMLEILANASIKEGIAGTSMRGIYSRIAAPVGKGAKILGKLNIHRRDADTGNMLDILDILDEIKEKTEHMGTLDRIELLTPVFGLEAVNSGLELLDGGTNKIRARRDANLNALGFTDKLADTLRDTLRGDINAAISSIEAINITLTELNDGPLRDLTQSFTDLNRSINDIIKSNDELVKEISLDFIETLGAAAKVILIVIGAIIWLKIAIISLTLTVYIVEAATVIVTAGMWLYAKGALGLAAALRVARLAVLLFSLALWANPVGVIILALGALIAIAVTLIMNWEKVVKFFKIMWKTVSELFSDGVDACMVVLQPFIDLLQGIWKLWNKIAGIDATVKITTAVGADPWVSGRQGAFDYRGRTTVVPENPGNNVINTGEDVVRPYQPPRVGPGPTSYNGSSGASPVSGQKDNPIELIIKNETKHEVQVTNSGPMKINLQNSGAFA